MRVAPARFGLVMIAVALSACAVSPDRAVQGAAEPSPVPADFKPMQFNSRMLLVTVPSGRDTAMQVIAESLSEDYGIGLMQHFPLSSISQQCIAYRVPPGRVVEDVIADLRGDSRVDSAQRNQVFDGLLATYSDPYAALQHGPNALGAADAHRISTGRGVKIGIIDTGVDTEHPDLAGRVVDTNNFVEKGKATFRKDSHGTGVAGVIAALADNEEGIFGVAPEAEVVAVKACGYPSPGSAKAVCSSWSLAQAIDYAAEAGAQVINMSLAGPQDALVERLILQAHARDITVVAAALADAPDPGFPASMDNVLSVLASDASGAVLAPDWRGEPSWAFAAPGADIVTTAPDAGYHFLSGSSLSAAHVTGVVALLLQHAPSLKPAEVKSVLERTSHIVPQGDDNVGFLDVCAALEEIVTGASCG